MLRRTRPNLREGHVFVGNIQPLEVAGGASNLNGVVVQVRMLGGGLTTNGMTADIEMVGPPGGIPKFELPTDSIGILGDKFRNGSLGMHARIITQGIEGKGQEKEMSILWGGCEEGTPEKGDLKHVLAEVVGQLGVERVWIGKENPTEKGR